MFGILMIFQNALADCGPVPPGMKQDKNCNLSANIPPTAGNEIIAEGSVKSVICEKANKKRTLYKATLKVDKIKTGPSIDKIDFVFEIPKGPSVLAGDKGEFTLKRKKEDWVLVSKVGSVFSGSILPNCK